MHRVEPVQARTEEQQRLARMDGLLWTAMLLGPFGAFVNTFCGFMVAHWVSQVASKRTGFLLDGFDVLLCLIGFVLGMVLRGRFRTANQAEPEQGRRYFMANLALLLAVLSFIAVVFQTVNMTMLSPSD